MGMTCILGSAAVGGVGGAVACGVDAASRIGSYSQGYQWGLELGEEAATRVEGIPISVPKQIAKGIAAGAATGGVGSALCALAFGSPQWPPN